MNRYTTLPSVMYDTITGTMLSKALPRTGMAEGESGAAPEGSNSITTLRTPTRSHRSVEHGDALSYSPSCTTTHA